MASLEEELQNCRNRWVEAKKKGDKEMMRVWERVGKFLKDMMQKKLTGEDIFEEAKKIFK